MPFVQTNRGKFFYSEYGSIGPVVYLLHGLTAKNQDWGGIPDILAKTGFHVYAFDMRGHGQSDKPEEGYSPEDHARDVEDCAQTLGHSRIHAVGHSTGGRNALVFAVLYPERAWSLTVIDQTLTADPASFQKYQERYKEYPTPFADVNALDKFLQKKFKKDEQRFFYYKGQFSRLDDGRWDWNYSTQGAWKTQKLGREKESYDLLEKVQCPMLFIKGANSDYVSAEEAVKISSLMPNGQMIIVSNAEHAVFRDNPEGFLKILVPFLLKQSQSGFLKP